MSEVFTEKTRERARKLAANGKSVAEIAEKIGTSKTAIYNWLSKKPSKRKRPKKKPKKRVRRSPNGEVMVLDGIVEEMRASLLEHAASLDLRGIELQEKATILRGAANSL